MTIRRAALLAALLSCTPAATEPPETARAQPPAPVARPFTAACDGLPATRPPGLTIEYELHHYERPEDLARVIVHDVAAPCPPDDMPGHLRRLYRARACVGLPAARLDALHAELVALGARRVRVREPEPWPHSAGAALTFAWDGRACRVGDVHNLLEPAPEDREAVRAMLAAVRAVLRS